MVINPPMRLYIYVPKVELYHLQFISVALLVTADVKIKYTHYISYIYFFHLATMSSFFIPFLFGVDTLPFLLINP
jgi:hypothetical protein